MQHACTKLQKKNKKNDTQKTNKTQKTHWAGHFKNNVSLQPDLLAPSFSTGWGIN